MHRKSACLFIKDDQSQAQARRKTITQVSGNISGLKALQLKQLKKISQRRIREDSLVSQDFARALCSLSFAIRRQIGALIKRSGHIYALVVGNTHSIMLPELERSRSTRLRGLRLVHTHLKDEPLSKEDLSDLTLLRLDYVTAVTIDEHGLPKFFYSAHILPGTEPGYHLEEAHRPGSLSENFSQSILYLEDLFAQAEEKGSGQTEKQARATLVGVYTPEMCQKRTPQRSMQELKELCHTAGVLPVDCITQKRARLDPLSLVGSGKTQEIALKAIQQNTQILIFDLELSPAQAKRLSEICDLKILDRTQLILDIFARNAQSRDGKLQVELAQLRYLKGRLSEKDDNMSRLTGGIGGRGPGETKLEIGRRRVNTRIQSLERELSKLKNRRSLNRARRQREIAIVSIVGYTNAGKSTLLNVLTHSAVLTENRLFATLDPTTRRLRFPKEKEIVLADTVGFIHDLPPELRHAFAATLEELLDAKLLLHCIDASDNNRSQKITAVEDILTEMQLSHLPILKVFNKCDLIPQEELDFLQKQTDSLCISASQKINLKTLLEAIEVRLFDKKNIGGKDILDKKIPHAREKYHKEKSLTRST